MRLLLAATLLVPAAALAQEPAKSSITVEATEVVRQKPDAAKLYMKVEVKNTDATAATDEAAEEYKKVTEGLTKLKLAGVTVGGTQVRSVRVETDQRNNVPGGGAPAVQKVVEYRSARPIIVSVANTDFDALTAAVEKLTLEASKLGAGSDQLASNYNYTSYGQERSSPYRLVYYKKGGWDDLTAPALKKATEKARAKAEALAAGAGVKLGDVLSVTEVPGPVTPNYNYNTPYNLYGLIATEPEDEYVDGELVRKVRVRVVYATK